MPEYTEPRVDLGFLLLTEQRLAWYQNCINFGIRLPQSPNSRVGEC